MKKRRILVIMSTIVLLCCIGLTIFAALTDAIIEKHTITLDSDLLKVSKTNSNYEDNVSYSSGDTIYVDNYEDGYDLDFHMANRDKSAISPNDKPVLWDQMTSGKRKDYTASFSASVDPKLISDFGVHVFKKNKIEDLEMLEYGET